MEREMTTSGPTKQAKVTSSSKQATSGGGPRPKQAAFGGGGGGSGGGAGGGKADENTIKMFLGEVDQEFQKLTSAAKLHGEKYVFCKLGYTARAE